jgi:hypothetical protein
MQTQNGTQMGKGIHFVPKSLSIAKNILYKKEGKHEIIVNLKELSSPTTMLCFKIKVACIICKIANTFYL